MPPISNNPTRSTQSTTNRPASRQQSSPPPTPTNSGPSDGISLSSEARELAQSNAERCNNDWRCLQQLADRGLLT